MSALREPSETRLAANEIQEQRKIKNRTIGSITFVDKLLDKDVKPKLEVKKEEVGYGKKDQPTTIMIIAKLDTFIQMGVCAEQNDENKPKRNRNCQTCLPP